MKRWLCRIVITAALIVVVSGVFFEAITHVGQGRLAGEPFYDGRPASFWASEIERWETHDPPYRHIRNYARRPPWPRWTERILPEPTWPALFDGDPAGLPVLQALRDHPSSDIQDWARIGIERLDNDERGPYKVNPLEVIFTAELYEVDEAFYKRLGNPRWRSMIELEEVERVYLLGLEPEKKQTGEPKQAGDSLFDVLKKKDSLMSVKDVKIHDGKEGAILSSTKVSHCLPSPAQLARKRKDPQKIEEGLALRAHVQISRDRRFVRVKFIEKNTELQGIDKVSVLIDRTGTEATAEIACVAESTFSIPQTLFDGGSILLPLQYRPADTKKKGRWLVVRIELRIYIEEEERIIQSGAKPGEPVP
jgi:hypothetical protein